MSSREHLRAASESSAQSQSSDALRSALHPAGDDPPLSLRPSVRRPMVVVRSGDGANVPDWSAESPSPPVASEITAVPPVALVQPEPAAAPDSSAVRDPAPSEPAQSEPFPLARDLEAPPPSAAKATDRVSVGTWDDPALDSPELESGSLRVPEEREPPSARVASVTPIPAVRRTPVPEPRPHEPPARDAVRSVSAPAPAPERASSRGPWWKLGAAAAAVTLGLVYLAGQGVSAPTKSEPVAARVEAVPAAETVQPKTVEPERSERAPEARAPAPAPAPPEEPQAAEQTARKQSPSGVSKAGSTKPVPPGATRVRLEVHPPDAKVGRRGVTQKPPYEFDVPKGKKVVLEVLRKGYTTRKVTLDGSNPRVVVGLARARSSRAR